MVLCTFFVLILEYYLMIWPLCSITRRVLIMALDCPMYKNVNILVEQFAFLFNFAVCTYNRHSAYLYIIFLLLLSQMESNLVKSWKKEKVNKPF